MEKKQRAPAPKRWGSSLGSLRDTFCNIPQRAQTLVTRWKRGVYRDQRRAAEARISAARGPLVRRIETAQTFLAAAEIDNLIGDYLGGASINDLAQQYGHAVPGHHVLHRARMQTLTSRRVQVVDETVHHGQQHQHSAVIAASLVIGKRLL